jgi:hypothetical protein
MADKETKEETKEAPEDAFSHYLELVDGRRVRHDVGNKPYAPFPADFNGVPVVRVHNATVPGKESTE